MTTRPSDSFTFETTYDTRTVKPEYAAHSRSKLGVTEDQLFTAFALVGAVSLFWRYTISLGVATLAITAFLWAMRQRSRRWRKRHAPLEEPPTVVRIRVTEAGYSIRGDEFFAETSWKGVINGFEAGDYFLVQSWRVPRLYLPLAELRAAGVYDRVRSIIEGRNAERALLRTQAHGA